MRNHPLIVASRASPLAKAQVELFKEAYLAQWPDEGIQAETYTSQGDIIGPTFDGKASFVNSIQQKVTSRHADVAVHSAKDMSCHPSEELVIAAYLPREEAMDVLVSEQKLPSFENNIHVWTSSPRRISQINHFFPHWQTSTIRGNLQTRLENLDQSNKHHALILAKAGIIRLGWHDKICHTFDHKHFIPAPGQGAIAIECHKNDHVLIEKLGRLNDPSTYICVEIERSIARKLNADCQTPLGCHAYIKEDQIFLSVFLGQEGKRNTIETTLSLPLSQHDILADRMIQKINELGANKIL